MPVISTYEEMVQAVKACLSALDGVGVASTCPGTAAPWSALGRPAQVGPSHPVSLWEIDFARDSEHVITAIPGTALTSRAKRVSMIVIEGWLPKDNKLNSDETWRNIQEEVLDALQTRNALGIPVIRERGPSVVADGIAVRQSLHQGDTARHCHFCRILLWLAQEYPFTIDDT